MTQEQDPKPSNMSKILGGFDRFSGGIEAHPATTTAATHVVSQQTVEVSVPHINDLALGEIAGVDFWMSLSQLQLAPPDDLLNSRYDPKDDPEFAAYTASLKSMGEEMPSLPILPANQNIIMPDGSMKPLFLIYDMPYVYYGLIELKFARAKVHIPKVAEPKAILLKAMGREGQLRREPSILETCLASKRLHEYYGCTFDEIAEQQAVNREDRAKPSITQIHFQISVAGLPRTVQDMLHSKLILWTHARIIAENFLGDTRTCEQLAILASQGKRLTVDEVIFISKRLKDKITILVSDDAGVISEVRQQPLKVVTEPDTTQHSVRSLDVGSLERSMIAKPANVRKEATRFTVVVIPGETPEKVAIAPSSFAGLIEWLNDRRTNTSIRDVEAVLMGFREAMRQEANRQGLVNQQGVLSQQIDATDPKKESKTGS